MSCSNCCGSNLIKRPSTRLALKLPATSNTPTTKKQKKSRSISWECLPFSSRTKKNNVNKQLQQQQQAQITTLNTINTNSTSLKTTTPNKKNSDYQSIPNKKKDKETSINSKPNELKQQQTNSKLITDNENLNSTKTFSVISSSNSMMSGCENETTRQTSSSSSSASSSSSSAVLSSSSTTTTPLSRTNHHPYATSLVNSGFGFGFDLQGGELDNQLTFIVNVQPNGDAARKGLIDGDILVSIQGKNVIGIRRTAIERILKQYKVDQEIEIVVCRLKDPSFILNLSKLISQQQQRQQQQQQQNNFLTSTSFDTAKFKNLNEQIFNELANFEDKSYAKKSAGLISNMKRSIRKEIFYEEKASSSKLRQRNEDKSYVSETQISLENTNNNNNQQQCKPILISVPINTSTINRPFNNNNNNAGSPMNTAFNLNETNLISIELNKINKQSAATHDNLNTPRQSALQCMTPFDSDTMSPNSIINSNLSSNQQVSTHDSGVYNESSSRKSNKSTSYYSDISIVVYDNMANITSTTNSGVNSVSLVNSNDKRTIIASSSSSTGFNTARDRMVLSVSQQQPNHQQPQRRSSTIHPNILSSTRSVNDFTGSIIAADRVNYFNKQVAESSKLNRNINNDSIYSSVIKKDSRIRSQNSLSTDLITTPLQSSQNPQQQQQRISICTINGSKNDLNNKSAYLPITIHESYGSFKKRSSSEAVYNQKETNDLTRDRSSQIIELTHENNNITTNSLSKPSPVIVDELNSKFTKPNLIVNLSDETSFNLNNNQNKYVNIKLNHRNSNNNNNNTNEIATTLSPITNVNENDLKLINNNENTSTKTTTTTMTTSSSSSSSKTTTGRIEQRLLELEKIAKNNIKQLEKFEQKYSSSLMSSSYSMNKTVTNNDGNYNNNNNSNSNDIMKYATNKTYETQTRTNSVEIPIDIQLDEEEEEHEKKEEKLVDDININKQQQDDTCQTNVDINILEKQKRLLEEVNFKPFVKQRIAECNNKNNSLDSSKSLKTTNKSKQNSLEASSESSSSTSSIYSAGADSSYSQPNKSINNKNLQTTIDIEIYNLEPKSKLISQSSSSTSSSVTAAQRQTLTIMPRANRRSKQKPFKIECNEECVDLNESLTSSTSKLNTEDIILVRQEQNQSDSSILSQNETTTNPIEETPNLELDEKHQSEKTLKLESETSDAKSEDYTIKNEKTKRAKLHNQHHRSQTILINQQQQQTTNDQNQPKLIKSKRESLTHRRDRRSRHTIPFVNSQTATNYDLNLKEFQQHIKQEQANKDIELTNLENNNTNDVDSDKTEVQKTSDESSSENINDKQVEIEPETNDEILNQPESIKCSVGVVNVVNSDHVTTTSDTDNEKYLVEQTKEIEKLNANLLREIKSDSENLTSKTSDLDGDINDLSVNNKRYSIDTANLGLVDAINSGVSSSTVTKNDSLVVNKTMRKKHDSTDTLDSASSYEIRFERPHYSLGSKFDLEDLANNINKNGLWNNLIDPSTINLSPLSTPQTLPTQPNELPKQESEEEESMLNANESLSPLQIESSNLETNPLYLITKLEETQLIVTSSSSDDENKLKQIVASPEMSSYADEFSSDSNNHPNLMIKDDSLVQQTDDKFNNSSSSFRSVEISPRTKISNEISDDSISDQLEMIKSVTQIINESQAAGLIIVDQTLKEEDTTKQLLDASCVSDSSNDVVSSLIDQVEMILNEEEIKKDDRDESTKILTSKTIENTSNVLGGHQSILDDGYGSTASMKNITNESCSSLDDATSECNSHFEITNNNNNNKTNQDVSIQSLLILKQKKSIKLEKLLTNTKLESLIDDAATTPTPTAAAQTATVVETVSIESPVPVELTTDELILVDDNTKQEKQADNQTGSLILEKTISYSSELTEKVELNNPQNETETKEVTVLEQIENTIKIVELEPINIISLNESNEHNEIKIDNIHLPEIVILSEQIAKEETSVQMENNKFDEQIPLHTVQAVEEIKEHAIISESTSLDEKKSEEKVKEEVKENLEKSSNMLQEPSIEIKNLKISTTSNSKHMNGSAVIDVLSRNENPTATTFTDVPPIYDRLKSFTSASENVVILPVLPAVAATSTSVTTTSPVPKDNLEKTISPSSLNASLSNVQDDVRSLSSNEYNNDQALSLSYPVQYKSTIAPRQTVISRRSNNTTLNQSQTLALSAAPISLRPIQSTVIAAVQSPAGSALKETRQREKKQLGELNDRFAGYVERVRFLEAQNKKLQTELSILKNKWGQETKQIEKMYQIELEEARNVLNDTSKNKDGLQIKLDRYEQELDKIRRKYNEVEDTLEKDKIRISSLQDQIATNESEINLLRRRLADLQDEEKKYKQEIMRMMNEIQKVQFELENEMKQRLMLENDKQSLEEELVFLKEIHAKEIEELKHLSLQESGIDPTMFFKNELANAIKEIREEYENLNQSQRAELEGWYRIKVEQAVAEIQRKQAQPIASHESNDLLSKEQARKLQLQILDSKRNIGDLKAKNAELEIKIRELEEEIKREETESSYQISNKDTEIKMLQEHLNRIINEYEDLLTTKSDLEVEIRTYRKLLEGEENKDGLKQIVENIEHRTRGLTSSSNRSFQDTISAANRYYYTPYKPMKAIYSPSFFKSNK